MKKFILLTISTLLIAIGIYFFKFPNNFTFGGVTGLAILLAKIIPFSASDITFFINMALLVIGLFCLGKPFAVQTAYTSILLSAALSLLERIYPMQAPFTKEPMLELAFAIALPALGTAILFNMGASSGGTDIIAVMFKKYTNINVGNGLLLSDLIITIAGCFVFDIQTGLFSFLGLSLKAFMVDTVIESINQCKYFNVVCEKPNPICNFIVHDLNRSATIFEAKGAFSGTQKHIILTVMNRHQAILLRQFIKKSDPNAFILISNTSEIIGKGFHSI